MTPRLQLLGLSAILALGCAGPRDLTMTCTLVGDPVRVHDEPAPHQIAKVGDAILVSWSRDDFTWRSQWVNAESGIPLGDVIDMGVGDRARPDWHVVDGGVEAALATDILYREPEFIPDTEFFGWWRLTPQGEVTRTPIVLEFPPEGCASCVGLGDAENEPGLVGRYKLLDLGGRLVGIVTAIAPRCVAPGAPVYGNYQRLRLYGRAPPLDRSIHWAGDECQLASAAEPYQSSVPWPVVRSDGTLGVFFTGYDHSFGKGRRYAVISSSGEVLLEPRTVGVDLVRSTTFGIGGEQGPAVRLGETVLFTDTLQRGYECNVLRRMHEDGRDAEDTPWQLPCRADPDTDVFWIHMLEHEQHAALVWSEYLDTYYVDNTTPWFERVNLALLNSRGQLASEPLTITPPEATALYNTPRADDSGPTALPFQTSVWRDDDSSELLVSYASRAPEHRGVFVRRVRCEPRST